MTTASISDNTEIRLRFILLGSRESIIQNVNDATLNFSRGSYWISGNLISAEVRIGSEEIYLSGRASYNLMQCMLQGEHATIKQYVLQGELEV